MVVYYSTQLSEVVRENRLAAEFHRPGYKFTAKNPDNWRKIGRCSKLCQYGVSIKMNEAGRGVPIYRLNEIEGCFLSARPSKYAPILPMVAVDFELEKRDILFCRTNGNINYVGRTGLFLGDNEAVFASYLVRVRTDPSLLLPEYLTIYLSTEFGRRQIIRRAMQSNQVNVSAAELKRIDAFLAPDAVQKSISRLVQDAYRKRTTGLALYTEAQQLLVSELGLDKQSFHEHLGYTDRFSIIGPSDIISSGRIDAQCFSPDALFYENWLHAHGQCDRLGSLLRNAEKGHHQAELANGSTDYCSIKHISDRELIEASKCSPPADTLLAGSEDLLLAITGATIGKIGIVKRYDRLAFSGDLLCLRTSEMIDPHYLLLALDHRLGQVQFNRWITGSTNGHLAPRDVKRVLVPRLNDDTEAKIAELVRNSLFKRLESDQLIEQAKIRVEHVVEEAVQHESVC